ncbi:circadian clock protein KaiC [Pontibacter ramchanderi]|uniref:non-specific serine/threonine protein kinase n=1 Tax=Pontibacter ramchanderi TaxID=1179743 RepID=A0A2N3V0I9_9BACT|nr:circadian clock protein KaiC [Pontibacter ramchanderi]PKV75086.1 circadian clock protein KaiC [Pontibacter ramchanderi]
MNIEKLPTGIEAFDHISDGGLPLGRTTLIAGSSGSAKTLFGAQFLAMGIMLFDQSGVFVTFEEQVDDIRKNLRSFNWDIDTWEKEGKWVFVDGSPKEEDSITVGDYDLSAFRIRLEHAINKIKAQRVVIDSIGSVFTQFPDMHTIRRELFKVAMTLRRLHATSIITAERTEEYGEISRFGVEEFLADNVIILRNVLNKEKRRRTIEILKFRGSNHIKGENPFTIIPDKAIVIIPLSAMELKQRSSHVRVTSGVPKLDDMCGGGFYRDSIILVSGATGAGKTLLVANFINGIREKGERCLLMAFEESREQLFRNAKGWGQDFEKLEEDGYLKVVCIYPEVSSLEDHFINIQEIVKSFKPDRIAIDSLSALTRTSSEKGFREFIIALTSFLKHEEITGMFTATTPLLTGGASVTEGNISTITDTIILLRYVEVYGEMQRAISVLKMRGSKHDAAIRQFTIDSQGMNIGEPFNGVSGILTGNPVVVKQNN